MKKLFLFALIFGCLLSTALLAEGRKSVVSGNGISVDLATGAQGKEVYLIAGTIETLGAYNDGVLLVTFKNLGTLPCGGHIFAEKDPVIIQMLIQAAMTGHPVEVVVLPGVQLKVSGGNIRSSSNKIISIQITKK